MTWSFYVLSLSPACNISFFSSSLPGHIRNRWLLRDSQGLVVRAKLIEKSISLCIIMIKSRSVLNGYSWQDRQNNVLRSQKVAKAFWDVPVGQVVANTKANLSCFPDAKAWCRISLGLAVITRRFWQGQGKVEPGIRNTEAQQWMAECNWSILS